MMIIMLLLKKRLSRYLIWKLDFSISSVVIKLASKYIEKVSKKAPNIPKEKAKRLSFLEKIKYL